MDLNGQCTAMNFHYHYDNDYGVIGCCHWMMWDDVVE